MNMLKTKGQVTLLYLSLALILLNQGREENNVKNLVSEIPHAASI